MSYSFSITAADKASAKSAVAKQLAQVVEQQPVHALDIDAALAAANAFIDLLPDDASQSVHVSMFGSVGILAPAQSAELRSAGVGVTVTLTHKSAG